jgi:hypothetical protein
VWINYFSDSSYLLGYILPEEQENNTNTCSSPSISLQKGGRAIRGIGEKFVTTPVIGMGSMTVPISSSPGRSDFRLQLTLSFKSGANNRTFGFIWSQLLTSINRKTNKGLPIYQGLTESDVFILSGVEDLLPVFRVDSEGNEIIAVSGQLSQ